MSHAVCVGITHFPFGKSDAAGCTLQPSSKVVCIDRLDTDFAAVGMFSPCTHTRTGTMSNTPKRQLPTAVSCHNTSLLHMHNYALYKCGAARACSRTITLSALLPRLIHHAHGPAAHCNNWRGKTFKHISGAHPTTFRTASARLLANNHVACIDEHVSRGGRAFRNAASQLFVEHNFGQAKSTCSVPPTRTCAVEALCAEQYVTSARTASHLHSQQLQYSAKRAVLLGNNCVGIGGDWWASPVRYVPHHRPSSGHHPTVHISSHSYM
jgi:hypothetical protein